MQKVCEERRGVMSFKGTETVRQRVKARLRGELWIYSAQEMEQEWLRDIVCLCGQLKKYEEVVEAARELISSPNFGRDQYVTIIRTRHFDALQRVLEALETEEQ